MKTITKADADYISKRFYDFHDKVCDVIRRMAVIKNEVAAELRRARLELCSAVYAVLVDGLSALTIDVPENM